MEILSLCDMPALSAVHLSEDNAKGNAGESWSLMIDRVPGLVHGRAIRAVADLVHVAFQRKRQGRSCHMRVGADRLWVINEVSGCVHGGAIWEIPDVIHEDGLGKIGTNDSRVRPDPH